MGRLVKLSGGGKAVRERDGWRRIDQTLKGGLGGGGGRLVISWFLWFDDLGGSLEQAFVLACEFVRVIRVMLLVFFILCMGCTLVGLWIVRP